MDTPALRWGVLAPGRIAADFVDALHKHTVQKVVAAGSRDADRAAVFAAAHGVERSYGSYEELVADPGVDVVYVASPHSLHAEHALLAMAAGKHVLIEKPMAPSAAEAQAIVDAARAAEVFAMEAMWTRYRPQSIELRRILDSGAIGPVHAVTAAFASRVEVNPASRLFDPVLAPGALLDIGVYPVSWASWLLGDPATIQAHGEVLENGVDVHAAILLGTASGQTASLHTGFRATMPVDAVVAGEAGRIELVSPFWAATSLRVLDPRGQEIASWDDVPDRPVREALSYQADALARFVAEGRTESPVQGLDETVRILATIDEVRAQLVTRT